MEDETEKQFIESCSGMSFVELENYIERCLNKLNALEVTGKNTPLNKQTYDKLLILLESKKDVQTTINQLDSSGQRLKDAVERAEVRFAKPTRPKQSIESFLNQIETARDNLLMLNIEQSFEQKWDESKQNLKVVRDFFQTKILPTIFEDHRRIANNPQFHSLQLKSKFGEIALKLYDSSTFSSKHNFKDWLINFVVEVFSTYSKAIEEVNKLGQIETRAQEYKRQADATKLQRKVELELQRQQSIIERIADLKKKIETIFDESNYSLKIEKLPWELLPKEKWTVEDVVKIFRTYSFKQWQDATFDESRLRKIINVLKPNVCYIGEDEFEGYVVFCFDQTEKVVMECPIIGNAVYVINGNWQEITKLSKREAKHRYTNCIKTINHNETWLERLQLLIKK